MEAQLIDIVIGYYYKKWARQDFREATIYLYLFVLLYSRVCDGYPRVLKFHGYTIFHTLLIRRVITYMYTCTTGEKMRGYGPYILSDFLKAPVTAVRR